MVTLVWGGGEGVLGEGFPPPFVFNYSKEALGGGGIPLLLSIADPGPSERFGLYSTQAAFLHSHLGLPDPELEPQTHRWWPGVWVPDALPNLHRFGPKQAPSHMALDFQRAPLGPPSIGLQVRNGPWGPVRLSLDDLPRAASSRCH